MLDPNGADSSTKISYLAICLQPPSQRLCFSLLLKLMLCLTFHIAVIEGSLNTWQGVLSPTRGLLSLGYQWPLWHLKELRSTTVCFSSNFRESGAASNRCGCICWPWSSTLNLCCCSSRTAELPWAALHPSIGFESGELHECCESSFILFVFPSFLPLTKRQPSFYPCTIH